MKELVNAILAIFLLFTLSMGIFSASVYVSKACAGDYRLLYLDRSKHLFTDTEFNEKHDGWFGEAKIQKERWLGVGTFTNSENTKSNIGYLGFENKIDNYWSWGNSLGFATGYEVSSVVPFATIHLQFNFDGAIVRAVGFPIGVASQYGIEF